MSNYLIFVVISGLLIIIGRVTRAKGFNKLTIRRQSDKVLVNQGDTFKITTIIENNKLLPLSFMVMKEKIPGNIPRCKADYDFSERGLYLYYLSKFTVLWYERMKRTYEYKAEKRGTYLLKEIEVAIGDIFGFSSTTEDLEDFLEVVVLPRVVPLKQLKFESTSITGDNIVKRWLYRDPLYIKGIREYNKEDRMKDIHWKSSLKMNKLMVKDYDFTSESEFVVILSVQCGEPYWAKINPDTVERGITLAAAFTSAILENGFPAGFWTNAQISAFHSKNINSVAPSMNSMRTILEMLGRADYTPRKEFGDFLLEKQRDFNHHCTYIMLLPYLNEEDAAVITKLVKAGYMLKVIDISKDGDLTVPHGVEKIVFRGDSL